MKSPLKIIIEKKPYLTWYIKNKSHLSNESMLEHVLNFGSWEDFQEIERGLGLKKVNTIFDKIASKKRVNLRPQTINYFKKYFQKYA